MENETNPLLEIIQNISQNLNNTSNNITNNFSNETSNSSNFNILDLINNFTNMNSQTNNSFDLSSLLKMQKIITALNEEDPRKNLLTSIKPFLRKSRQNKIDQYITYLSVISAIGIFNDKKE